MSAKLFISNKEVRRIAEAQRKLDAQRAHEIRQHFTNIKFPVATARVEITGLEELESKSIQEYEKHAREHISNVFSNYDIEFTE